MPQFLDPAHESHESEEKSDKGHDQRENQSGEAERDSEGHGNGPDAWRRQMDVLFILRVLDVSVRFMFSLRHTGRGVVSG